MLTIQWRPEDPHSDRTSPRVSPPPKTMTHQEAGKETGLSRYKIVATYKGEQTNIQHHSY